MNICVVGWYFYPELYKMLEECSHNVFVVKHKLGDSRSLPSELVSNVGLEFGAYDWYLMHHWKGGATLFMHDDVSLTAEKLDEIERECSTEDQACVFSSMKESQDNGTYHGRMIYCSHRLLSLKKEDGGIWFDAKNTGQVGSHRDDNDTHNAGIKHFQNEMVLWSSILETNKIVLIPDIKLGFRGNLEV
jgi:hypothetical protein